MGFSPWATRLVGYIPSVYIWTQLSRRRVQEDIDLHRLWLVTNHLQRSRGAAGVGGPPAGVDSGADAAAIAAEAPTSHEALKAAVQSAVHAQAASILTALRAVLRARDGPPAPAPAAETVTALAVLESLESGGVPRRRHGTRTSGLAFAVGTPGAAAAANSAETPSHAARRTHDPRPMAGAGAPLSTPARAPSESESAAVAEELQRSLGFRLALGLSGAPSAGLGLFLRGAAPAGSIVAFYPGVTYGPADHHLIPGVMDRGHDNPYLMGRYDGVVIDGLPWGKGGMLGPPGNHGLASPEDHGLENHGLENHGLEPPGDGPHAAGLRAQRARLASVCEPRQPLALAHFANHPPPGTAPNALACPLDFPRDDPSSPRDDSSSYLCALLPNAPHEESPGGRPTNWLSRWLRGSPPHAVIPGAGVPVIPGIVLVAARAMRDEEVFLNYRLNPEQPRPAWYTPVDPEEDARRWA